MAETYRYGKKKMATELHYKCKSAASCHPDVIVVVTVMIVNSKR